MPPKKAGKSAGKKNTKRKADSENESSAEEQDAKPVGKKARVNSVESLLYDEDFQCDCKSISGQKSWNLKICSWNVNGLRALIDKKGFDFLKYENPDIFCIQETKCIEAKVPDKAKLDGYKSFWSCCDSGGYSGVGLFTKVDPINVTYGIGVAKHDEEGRVITAEFDKFYLVTAYVPNAGRKLVRLDYRMEWDKDFEKYLVDLDKKKPVILCGDLNVAHNEIDLANPKTNKKTAGFTQQERDGFSSLLKNGFVDSFRRLHPDQKGAYTFWTYLSNARSKNVGWRLDYFVLSERLVDNLCESCIRSKVNGSDHCPITLFLSL